jgi:hypothetical protein
MRMKDQRQRRVLLGGRVVAAFNPTGRTCKDNLGHFDWVSSTGAAVGVWQRLKARLTATESAHNYLE